jgi:hypothetical protein
MMPSPKSCKATSTIKKNMDRLTPKTGIECLVQVKESLESALSRSDINHLDGSLTEELRRMAISLLNRLDSKPEIDDKRRDQGDKAMKTIGRIYAPVGTVVINEENEIAVQVCSDSNVSIEIREIVASVNEDLKKHVPLTTAKEDAHEMSSPPTDEDLDVLADAISLQSGGLVVMSHNSPMLDAA